MPQVEGIELIVTVHEHHERMDCALETGMRGASVPAMLGKVDDPNLIVCELIEDRPRIVGAAIVDDDDLEGVGELAQRRTAPSHDVANDLAFVEGRHYHRHSPGSVDKLRQGRFSSRRRLRTSTRTGAPDAVPSP